MSFAVVGYFAFLLIGLVLYYVLPKKVRWIWLLALSYIYYFTFSIKTSIYMVFTTVVIYMGGIWLDKIITDSNAYITANKASMSKEEKKAYKDKTKKRKRQALLVVLLLCFGQLAVIKYTDFAIENINSIISLFGGQNMINLPKFALPLGISFFTFQSASYIIDVYQGKYRCQNNVFKLGLFVSFFPQLLQGPIGRYDRLSSQLYEGNSFELKNVQYGLQRICWGLAKKVILADRAAVLVNMVFEDYDMYGGLLNIVAVLMYSVQLYMDFSGGIDVVIGTAQMFGITMDENFRQPYFSKSIGEFWRRWHITLGTWMKDYIFYPMSLSKAMNKFGKWGKKHFGNVGRTLPICFANLVIFFVVGIWHGASWKYILYGFYNGIIIALSNLLKPVYASMAKKCHINTSSRYWKVVSIIRTFIIVNIGWLFDACLTAELAFKAFTGIFRGFTFSVLANGSLLRLGLNMRDYKILIVGTVILFITSVMKEKGINLREFVAQRPLVVRWALYIILIFATAPFGYVGSTTEFVYAQF